MALAGSRPVDVCLQTIYGLDSGVFLRTPLHMPYPNWGVFWRSIQSVFTRLLPRLLFVFLFPRIFGFTRIGEEERRDGEAIALHKTHIWANSLKPVCFLCFLLLWCPLLPFIETGTLKIYTKMVLYMKNEIFDLKYPLHGV